VSHAEERARQELDDTETRLRELRAERDALHFWQRDRRAALDEHIRGHKEAAVHWQERLAQLADARDLADEDYAMFIEEHGDRLADIADDAPAPVAEPEIGPAPVDSVDVGIDLGP
jgi:hypothetical protein